MNDKIQMTRETYGGFYRSIEEKGLITTGTIGCGKTTLVKYIAKQLIQDAYCVKIFDVIGNWKFNFIPSVIHQVIINPYEKCVNDFQQLQRKSVVYTLKMRSELERRTFIQRILEHDLERQKELFWVNKGKIDAEDRVIYIVEEANTILSTYSIREGFFKDFVAYGRNFGCIGIYIMQRLADSSPKVIERIPNLAIGKTVGSNDRRRIKDIMPKELLKGRLLNKEHHFELFFNGEAQSVEVDEFKGKILNDCEVDVSQEGFFRRHTNYTLLVRKTGEDFEDIDSESEIEIDESEEYPEDW